jgi:hypothetical protein
MKIKLILVLLVFGVLGCSRIDVVYDLAPRLVTNNLDDNFDFSSERYDQVKQMIASDFKNNKGLLKTEVIARIDELLAAADEKNLTEAQAEQFFQNIRKMQSKVIQSFAPSFNEVVTKMTKEEFENVKKETTERHEKAAERLEDKTKFKEKSFTGFERNMETLFDEVTDEQKKIYSDFIDRNYDYFKLQLEHRKSYLKRFEETFEDKVKLTDLVMKYYSADDSIKTAEQLKVQQSFTKDMFATTTKIWATLNAEQRIEYKKSLNEIKKDIEALK